MTPAPTHDLPHTSTTAETVDADDVSVRPTRDSST